MKADLRKLGSRLASKQSSQPASHVSKQPHDSRLGIMFRVSPKLRRELKMLSAETDTTIQDMLMAAVNDIMRKNGRPGEWS
jgi:hypothetical protein